MNAWKRYLRAGCVGFGCGTMAAPSAARGVVGTILILAAFWITDEHRHV